MVHTSSLVCVLQYPDFLVPGGGGGGGERRDILREDGREREGRGKRREERRGEGCVAFLLVPEGPTVSPTVIAEAWNLF